MASSRSTLHARRGAHVETPSPAGDTRAGQRTRGRSRASLASAGVLWSTLALFASRESAQAQERTDAAVPSPAAPSAPASAGPALPGPAAPSATPSAPPAAVGAADAQPTIAAASPDLAGLRAALDGARCHPFEVLELSGRWYAACGTGGVAVFAQTATGFVLIDRRTALGDVRDVFSRNGLVWVEVQHNEARPFSELGSVTASAAQPLAYAPAAGAPAPLSEREPGDRAESIIAPPRIPNSLSFEFALRPYLPIDELAFAAVGQLGVTYRGERPWYVRGELYPIGGLVGKGRERGIFGAFASGGYDHPLFSLGIGVGALRGTTATYIDYVDGSPRAPDHSFALSVTQSVRLGALDGLHLAVTNAFVLEDDRWEFGFVDVLLQAPAGRRTWIVVDGGGGGYARFFYGEVGLRRLVRGDRGHGALFVRPSVGAAGVEADDGGLAGGPMVGIHLELRR